MLAKENKALRRVILSITLFGVLLVTLLIVPIGKVHGATTQSEWQSGHRTWHAIVGTSSRDQAIQGMAFLPGALWIDVGDTVVWTVGSGDIHTVTFLPPGQVPPSFTGTPNQVNRVGGNVYDGKHYFNSGVMTLFPSASGFPHAAKTYALTFAVPGDFTYYCLVHPSMIAVVHVRPAGTPYPFSQEEYNNRIQERSQAILHDGQKLAHIAKGSSSNHNVIDGIGDGLASVMRFFPQRIVIHVGDTVTFTNRDVMEPHTVTFGPPPKNDAARYGNPSAFNGQPLNSGFIGPFPGTFGPSYTVKFVKAGTYPFYCALHDYLGMDITIVVLK
jgi:plastocyanin